MSTRYNKFGTDLKAAFVEARERYANALEKLEDAERMMSRAKADRTHTADVVAANISQREALLSLAKANLKAENNAAWIKFSAIKSRLTAELREAVKRDNAVNPADVDGATMELLKSGVCRGSDYEALARRFDGNNTMTRLIGKYASDAAQNATDASERGQLQYIADNARTASDGILEGWDSICAMCDAASGQKVPNAEPAYVLRMNAVFDTEIAPALEGF